MDAFNKLTITDGELKFNGKITTRDWFSSLLLCNKCKSKLLLTLTPPKPSWMSLGRKLSSHYIRLSCCSMLSLISPWALLNKSCCPFQPQLCSTTLLTLNLGHQPCFLFEWNHAAYKETSLHCHRYMKHLFVVYGWKVKIDNSSFFYDFQFQWPHFLTSLQTLTILHHLNFEHRISGRSFYCDVTIYFNWTLNLFEAWERE